MTHRKQLFTEHEYEIFTQSTYLFIKIRKRMTNQLLKLTLATVFTALSTLAIAQLKPGDIDQSYAPHFDGNILSMVVQNNGKHVYAGSFKNVGDRAVRGLIRLNEDGTPDPTFNAGGSGFDNYATALAATPEGKFIVAGTFTSYNGKPVGSLVRINTDGTLDETFKGDNAFTLEGNTYTSEVQLQHIATLPNGQFYVAGGFNRVNGKPAPLIAHRPCSRKHSPHSATIAKLCQFTLAQFLFH